MNTALEDPINEVQEEKVEGLVAEPSASLLIFTKILRIMGSVTLIGAAATFVVQGITSGDSLTRYYMFFGFTLFMVLAGIFSILKLKEDKGARTFLGLSAAFLPANFIQLGAFIVALVYGANEALPQFFIFRVTDPTLVLLTVIVAPLLLLGSSFISFSALIRSEAKRFTILYGIANLMLLLPTRDADYIAAILLVLFGVLFHLDRTLFQRIALYGTFEGIYARLMLAVPPTIILARNLLLYDSTAGFRATVGIILSALLLVVIPRHTKKIDGIGEMTQCFSFAPALYAWIQLAPHTMDRALNGAVVVLPFALIAILMSTAINNYGSVYRRIAAWGAILFISGQLLILGGVVTSFLSILTAITVITGAVVIKDKGLLYAGIVGFTIGILYHIRYAAEQLYFASPWLALAVTGTIIVLLASYLERNFQQLRVYYQGLEKRLASWS
jgi:hypothetical protein